ncbi:MAG: sulfurtransferase complex subunit TusB [Pseudomonadaceae bacterium]|nr:sulfurtransferase complex subunit TusB [Pseudomonadaceae bacterium]
MSTLHQINRLASLDACCPALAINDSILLIEEAVSVVLEPNSMKKLLELATTIYVHHIDATARGIQSKLIEAGNAKAVSTEDWVKLCTSHDRVVSW